MPPHLSVAKRESQHAPREGLVHICLLELSLDESDLGEKHPFMKAMLNYVLYPHSVTFF